jgi:acyl-CoA thioesterase-2
VTEAPGSLLNLLQLEKIDLNIYRAGFVFDEPFALYGGQVATQSLLAAALTVDSGRLPHSLHGYFLRPGDASKPTVFQVFRDRDGGSYSARRVVALQNGRVIFNMSASFALPGKSPDVQGDTALNDHELPMNEFYPIPRLFSFEGRKTEPGFPEPDYPQRFWARCTADLSRTGVGAATISRDLMNILAVTYLSDISSGIGTYNTEEFQSQSSLDHTLWFHRPMDAEEWMLMDLRPRSVAYGRGLYHGDITDSSGVLLASISQQVLFRKRRAGGGAAPRPA